MPVFSAGEPVILVCLASDRRVSRQVTSWCDQQDTSRQTASLQAAADALDQAVDLLVIGPNFATKETIRWVRGVPYFGPILGVSDDETLVEETRIEATVPPSSPARVLHETIEDVLLEARTERYAMEVLVLLTRKRTLEDDLLTHGLEDNRKYTRIREELDARLDRLGVDITPISSKYRPDDCSNCGLVWDRAVDEFVGFEHISSFTWKCRRCGEVVPGRAPFDRSVAW